jgi:hypothetical protein
VRKHRTSQARSLKLLRSRGKTPTKSLGSSAAIGLNRSVVTGFTSKNRRAFSISYLGLAHLQVTGTQLQQTKMSEVYWKCATCRALKNNCIKTPSGGDYIVEGLDESPLTQSHRIEG